MSTYNKEAIKQGIKSILLEIYDAECNYKESDLYKNTLDCFSSVLDCLSQGVSFEEWMRQEKARQIQKTKQNKIGDLHESILGTFKGVTKLNVGKIYDVHCPSKKIIAEIKNKHNTTKGNHKREIYNDLESVLNSLSGYTAYYVEILPKNGKAYNVPFTPPDNRNQVSMKERSDIRIIDGKSFYSILTGDSNALANIYSMLPAIYAEVVMQNRGVTIDTSKITSSNFFKFNFNKIYPNSL